MATPEFIPFDDDEGREKVSNLQSIPNLLVADVNDKKKRGTGSSDGEPQVKTIKTAGVDKLKEILNDSISETDTVIEMNLKASKAFQDDQNRLKYVSMQLKKQVEAMSR